MAEKNKILNLSKRNNTFSSVYKRAEELKEYLAMTGTTEQMTSISKRSKIIKEGNIDVDNMTIKELIEFIRQNPTVLKRPLILNDRLLQVGYNEEEIRVFIPHELRYMQNQNCGKDCPNYVEGTCECTPSMISSK